MKYNMKAYTLLEVLLTLVISSFIIIMIYTIFLYLDKQMIHYQNRTAETQEYRLMQQVLNRDLYECEFVNMTPNEELEFVFYDKSIISYKKMGEQLLRKKEYGEYAKIGTRLLFWDFNKTTKPTKEGAILTMQTVIDRDTLELYFTKMKIQIDYKFINP